MLEDERDFGGAGRKLGGAFHLCGENLEIEGPAIVGKLRNVFLQNGIAGEVRTGGKPVLRVVVPLQLHPQPAHAAIFGQAVQLRPHVLGEKIGVADDALWKPGFIGGPLDVSDFVLEGVLRPIALHVDGLRHAAARQIGQVFADQIVAPDCFVGPEDARQHRPVEPRQVLAAPDVVVRVDYVRHAAFSLAISRTLLQMLSIEPPSPSLSR